MTVKEKKITTENQAPGARLVVAGLEALSDGEQELPLWTKLHHLADTAPRTRTGQQGGARVRRARPRAPLFLAPAPASERVAGRGGSVARLVEADVGDPDVAPLVRGDAVRAVERAGAPGAEHLPGPDVHLRDGRLADVRLVRHDVLGPGHDGRRPPRPGGAVEDVERPAVRGEGRAANLAHPRDRGEAVGERREREPRGAGAEERPGPEVVGHRRSFREARHGHGDGGVVLEVQVAHLVGVRRA